MTDIIHIPLSDLLHWDGNVRKTGAQEGLEELMASIAAHGLLQPLVVKPAPAKGKTKGKYHVVAGQRRLMALNGINYAEPVPCTVIAEDADATEISLVENTIRQQMHPIDQFHAFRQMQESGSTPADIAVRFGYAESTVLKLLKLARVSPKILDAYRAGELTLEHVQAFASSDDTERQEQVFEDFNPDYNDADDIRSELKPEADIPATDKRAVYVGIEAYVKAGGKTRSDLFTDSTYLLDPELLDNLASLKLSKSLKKIEKEGWAWVEIDPDLSWEKRNKFGRIYEGSVFTSEQQEKYDALQAEAEELESDWYKSEADEKPERLVTLEAGIEEMETAARGWKPGEQAIAGAIIMIDRNGKLDIERGMVKPEDKPRLKALEQAKKSGNPEDVQVVLDAPAEKGMSASLIEELTKHRTAALSATMATNPEIALAATVHAMAFPIFYRRTGQTATNVSAEWGNRRYHPDGSPTNDELDREESLWRDRIPGDERHFWQWCIEADQTILLGLLAFCTAISIDAVRRKQDRANNVRLANADLLASALQLDMTCYFRPDAENYFGKISRDMILADLKEITGAEPSPAQLKMKKGELARLAGKLVDGTGWLPAILRSADDNAEAAKLKAARKKRAA